MVEVVAAAVMAVAEFGKGIAEDEVVQRKVALISTWGTDREIQKLRGLSTPISEAKAEERQKKRQRYTREVEVVYPKALTRKREAERRTQEERAVFASLRPHAPEKVEDVMYSRHLVLSSARSHDPLGWIPVPRTSSRPGTKIREAKRRVLAGASGRLKRAVRYEVDFEIFVLPMFSLHKGTLYLSGDVEAVVDIELELREGTETFNGVGIRRPERVGHEVFVAPVRARVKEIALDLGDTAGLPLPLRRFLAEPDWALMALRAGMLDPADYLTLKAPKAVASDRSELSQIIAFCSGWGYSRHLLEAAYYALDLPAEIPVDEKAARITGSINSDRARKKAAVSASQPVEERHRTKDGSGWLEVLATANVIGIFGPMGGGKTALAHYLLELLGADYTPYIVLPDDVPRPPLPPWIRVVSRVEDAPDKSAILSDETGLSYHARESATSASKQVAKWVGLRRHHHQKLILLGRLGAELDKALIDNLHIVALKRPLEGQSGLERPALRSVVKEAETEFAKIKGESNTRTYVWNRRTGERLMLSNPLPTYWSDELSTAYAGTQF